MDELLKKSPRCRIYKVIDDSGKKMIKRIIENGDADVYMCLRDNPHKGMPKIYSVNSENNEVVVMEEFIEGINVSAACIKESDLQRVMVQLCRILIHIHSLGIIHRDIKPSNILISENNNICLIDFDAARIIKPAADSDTRYLGTEGFAPPEQYGFSQTDMRSDIYALGKTFECLLGSLAYDKRYRNIIIKCTQFDPNKRYSDVNAVMTDFNKRKRHIALWSAVASAFVLCIGLVIYISNDIDRESVLVKDAVTPEDSLIVTSNNDDVAESVLVFEEPETEITFSEISTHATTFVNQTEIAETSVISTVTTNSETVVSEKDIQNDDSHAQTSAISPDITAIETSAELVDPYEKYKPYYKSLDFDKSVRISDDQMEKPLLFQSTDEISFEYIIIDAESLKENKYVTMLCDYNEDGYDDIFQLSAYNPEGQDEFFRRLCVSVVEMYDIYPDFHIISDNTYFTSLIQSATMNQETGMLNNGYYIQLSVLDVDNNGEKDMVLSFGRPDNFIQTQIFYDDNIEFDYSSSEMLNMYVESFGPVYYNGKGGLGIIEDGEAFFDSDDIYALSLNATLTRYKYVDINSVVYELEDDPLYRIHQEFASKPIY